MTGLWLFLFAFSPLCFGLNGYGLTFKGKRIEVGREIQEKGIQFRAPKGGGPFFVTDIRKGDILLFIPDSLG